MNNDSLYRNGMYVIGVGASAGGLEALSVFLSKFPSDAGSFAIIIAQHLSPTYKSMLVELLARQSSLEVVEAINGSRIEQGKVYVTPPDCDITVTNDGIKLEKPVSQAGPKPCIDIFLKSLAEAYRNQAIGVILSGTGSDGAGGIRAIKEQGGYSLVQHPASAKYRGMPDSAIATDMVDWVLPPEKIGLRIAEIILGNNAEEVVHEKADSKPKNAMASILELVERKTGVDFSNYKNSTLIRRMDKRIKALGMNSLEAYLDTIQKDESEIKRLYDDILISVTAFFRDPRAFEILSDVLAELVSQKGPGDPIRIWVPGCATGEEAYSVAMLLFDALGGKIDEYKLQIFATDIDEKALNTARRGIYSEAGMKGVPVEMINRHFERNENGLELNKAIRSMVLFSRHDLTCNPPFLKLDLISCRNLLIYFNEHLQQRVISLFHYSLQPSGYLFLGKSESTGMLSELFHVVNAPCRIFRKKAVENMHSLKFSTYKPGKTISSRPYPVTKKTLTLNELLKETIYSYFDHPYIIINANMEVVMVGNGKTDKYLRLAPGVVDMSIFRLVREDLSFDLRAVMLKAFKEKATVKSAIKRFDMDGVAEFLRIRVQPLLYNEAGNEFYLVVFESILPEELPDQRAAELNQEPLNNYAELEYELAVTKENLQNFIEELETSNEELQSLNEELQSTNEELQSTNEELETTNEELQSINEELQVAHAELRTKNIVLEEQGVKLSESENNVRALLNNTLKSFMLLDAENIIDLNASAERMCRELTGKTIKAGEAIWGSALPKMIRRFSLLFSRALKGKTVSGQCCIKKGKKRVFIEYSFLPVAANGRVERISLGMTDITEMVALYESVSLFKERLELSINAGNLAWWDWDYASGIVEYSDKKARMCGFEPEEFPKKVYDICSLIHPDDYDKAMDAMRRHLMGETDRYEVEYRLRCKDGGYIFLRDIGSVVARDNNKPVRIVGVVQDITKYKNYEKAVQESEERYRTLFSAATDAMLVIDPDSGSITDINQAASILYGYSKEEFTDLKLKDILEYTDKSPVFAYGNLSVEEKTAFLCSIGRHKRKDGILFPVDVNSTGMKLSGSDFIIASVRDMTEKKKAEEILEAKRRSDLANQAKSLFLANMSHEIRTPMNGIVGFLGLLENTALSDEQKQYLKNIREASDTMLSVIDDILDITKIEAGKLTIHRSVFKLRELIESSAFAFSAKAAEKSIELALLIHPDFEEEAVGDLVRLRQIITNLVSNAVKFTSSGSVCIEAWIMNKKTSSMELHMSVKDSGVGVPQEYQTALFQPFTQADSSSSKKYGGTGLGLSICRKLVEMMEGSIDFESREGSGSVFHFHVLLGRAADKESVPSAANRLKGLKVGLVGGSKTSTMIAASYLNEAGCVVSTDNMPGDVDIALVDSAHETVRRAAAANTPAMREGRGTPCLVLLVDIDQPVDLAGVRGDGFSDYLRRPYGRNALYDKLLSVYYGEPPAEDRALAGDPQTAGMGSGGILSGNIEILIAEDNELNRRYIVKLLELEGLRCDIAENGKEVLALCSTKEYDIVFLDCQMPVMDGYEAARQIRIREKGKRHTPIIAVTAYAVAGDREKCLQAGMDDYISKPFEMSQIKGMIAQYCSVPDKTGDLSRNTDDYAIRLAKRLMEATGFDESVSRELAWEYRKQAVKLIDRMEGEIGKGNMEEVGRILHQLKGSSGNIRATEVVDLVRMGEDAMRESSLVKIRHVNGQIKRILEQESGRGGL